MSDLTIMEVAPPEKKGAKGRGFRAICLTATCADSLWENGRTDSKSDIERPVHAIFLGADTELRPFAANLQLGNEVLVPSSSYRSSKSGYVFLRSARYRFSWQREPEGTVLTVFLPELFQRDPGMVDPEHVRFVMMPSKLWAAGQQDLDVEACVKHALRLPTVRALNKPPTDERGFRQSSREEFVPCMPAERLRSMVASAYLFAMYLDRRTRAPIPADGRFYMQLYLAFLRDKLATWPTERRASFYGSYDSFGLNPAHCFRSESYEAAGFLQPVAVNATHDAVEALLAKEAALYFELTGGK